MNQNTIIKTNFLNQMVIIIKKNLKTIILILSIFFLVFLALQIFNFYSSSKIKKNSIVFFNSQNLEDLNLIQDSILQLSNQNNFYGILSKLELIKINTKNENYEYVSTLYQELLADKKINNIYQSAIAANASYQFINLSLMNTSINYTQIINTFISNIDDELINYKGIKLELVYLSNILEVEKENIKYNELAEVQNLYENIMSSPSVSSSIKERVKKIHEFFSYK